MSLPWLLVRQLSHCLGVRVWGGGCQWSHGFGSVAGVWLVVKLLWWLVHCQGWWVGR